MIKFEFPADRKDIALAIGNALLTIAGQPATASAVIQGTAMREDVGTNALIDDAEQQQEQSLDEAAVADLQADAANESAITSGGAKVDLKGVAFDAKMCADAADPFYKSGKYKGQWKKKGGANGPAQEVYDAWHAAELLKVTSTGAPGTDTSAADQQVNAGTVWQAPAAQDAPKVPANAGELFAWISEMQTAGRLSQPDVDAAYPAIGLDPAQLWSAAPDVQAQMVAALHKELNAKAAA